MKYSVRVRAVKMHGDGPVPHDSPGGGRGIEVDSESEAKRIARAMYEHGKKLAAKKK